MAICHVPDAARYGAVELAEGRVRGFCEKGQTGPGWINGGVYVLGPELRDRMPAQTVFSFEQDLLVPEVETIRAASLPPNGCSSQRRSKDFARARRSSLHCKMDGPA